MTRRESTVLLNSSFLETRMAELGLKQWWLAEQVGVNARTVLRWVNGQVKRMQRDHLDRLARCLECAPEEIVLADEQLAVAEPSAQAEAARCLAEENLVSLLTPSSSYPMAEALIKSALSPGLPLHSLGKLQNLLALAVVRQFRLPEAIEHARKAEAIGERLGNRVLCAHARYHQAWARLYGAELPLATQLFASCVEPPIYLDDPQLSGLAWFGLGSCQGYCGELGAAVDSLRESVRILLPLGVPTDSSQPLYVAGVFLLEARRYDEARPLLEQSLALAERVSWKSGIGRAESALAELEAESGAVKDALGRFARAYRTVEGERFIHPHLFLAGARVHTLAGEREHALELLREGLVFAERFALEKPFVLRATADLLARAEPDRAGALHAEADRLFRQAGAPARARDATDAR